jgi:hypothetical protein
MTSTLNAFNNQDSLNSAELEFEVNPLGEPLSSSGLKKLKCYTYGQLYIYVNLEFARRMVEFTGRVLDQMDKNYRQMV